MVHRREKARQTPPPLHTPHSHAGVLPWVPPSSFFPHLSCNLLSQANHTSIKPSEFRKIIEYCRNSSNVDVVIVENILRATRFGLRSTVCSLPPWGCATCCVQVDQLIPWQETKVQVAVWARCTRGKLDQCYGEMSLFWQLPLAFNCFKLKHFLRLWMTKDQVWVLRKELSEDRRLHLCEETLACSPVVSACCS